MRLLWLRPSERAARGQKKGVSYGNIVPRKVLKEMPPLYVVRRCDGFHGHWRNMTDPLPMWEAHAIYERLTRGGSHGTGTIESEHYDIFAIDRPPQWRCCTPIVRRLHSRDAVAIEAHLLRLNARDRRLRFFQDVPDAQIRSYVRSMDYCNSLILGAVWSDRMIGVAEALLGPSAAPRDVEIAVSVDLDYRGCRLGRYLVGQVVDRATLLGAPRAYVLFLQENRPIQRIVRALGGFLDMENLMGVLRPNEVAIPDTRSVEALKT